VKSWNF